jgi:HEAT repeat protein
VRATSASSARQRPIGFSPVEISSLINTTVVEEHASEAAFLYGQRNRAASAPHYKLKHLAALDDRILGHLEGLHIAGDDGWRAALGGLEHGEPGGVFVASYLAFAGSDAEKVRHVLQLGLSQPTYRQPLEDGLTWLDPDEIRRWLDPLGKSPSAEHRRLALSALVSHDIDPGEALASMLASPEPRLRARAARATGELKRLELRDALYAYINDSDAETRRLFQAGEEVPDLLGTAVLVAMMCGSREWARERIRALAAEPEHVRLAIRAAGALGDPAVVPWLIEQMVDPKPARVAGDALSMISGADLDYLGLKQDPPEDYEETLSEDAGLPWPDHKKVLTWWDAHRGELASGQRYLAGRPASASSAVEVLRLGYQRQRQAAAIYLLTLSESRSLFAVADRSDRQRRRLRV